ncbi:MAG: hypothetical protein FWC46_01885 [Actinomycetia bacterium]|nr:hypothetical protein [Actinomycetes bacterium]
MQLDRFLKIFLVVVAGVIVFRVVGFVVSALMWLFWVALIVAAVAIPIAYIARRAVGPGDR